jgi:O-antigen/teichoic acid export membrane protein
MKSKVGSEIVFVPIGKAVVTTFLFITNILLTRYLGTEAFGIYSSCIALLIFFYGVVGDSLDFGVLRFVPLFVEKNRQKALLTLKVVFKMKVVIGATLVLILFPLATFIGKILFHSAEFGNLIRLVFFGILGTLLFRSALIYFQVHQDFKKYLCLDFINTALKLSIILLLIYLHSLTVMYSVAVYTIVPFVIFLLSFWILLKNLFTAKGQQKKIFAEMVHFTKWLMLSSIVGALHYKLDILMLSFLKGSEDTGIYAAASNLAILPDVLSSFFAIVLYPKIMPMCHRGEFTQFFIRYLKKMMPICVIGFFLAFLIAKPLIILLYSSNFAGSALIFKILIPGAALWLLIFPVALPFMTLNRPFLHLPLDIITLIIIFSGNILLIPKYGPSGAAVVTVFARLIIGGLILTRTSRNQTGIFSGSSCPLNSKHEIRNKS